MVDSLAHRTPGDGIAQRFACRIDLENVALIFCRIVTIKVAILQTDVLKMYVIKNSPFNASFTQEMRQSRFPDPFRDPHTRGLCAEIALDTLRQTANLPQFVGIGDSG